MGSFRRAWTVLVQGRIGLDAALYAWHLVFRLLVVAVILMAAISALLALEPTP